MNEAWSLARNSAAFATSSTSASLPIGQLSTRRFLNAGKLPGVANIPEWSTANKVRLLIPKYKVDLLNITVRNVKRDDDTFLKYAKDEVFGFVMLYNQKRDAEAEAEMKRCTQALIDAALALKGTYNLPYRLHATREQLHRAYPQAREFFGLKKKYDSGEVFSNFFYETYK